MVERGSNVIQLTWREYTVLYRICVHFDFDWEISLGTSIPFPGSKTQLGS